MRKNRLVAGHEFQHHKKASQPLSSSSEGEEEEALSEEDGHDGSPEWMFALEASVYDEALVLPLIKGQTGGRCGFVFAVIASLMILLLNGLLQFFVLAKVNELTNVQSQDIHDKLWSLCKVRTKEFPFRRMLEEQPSDGRYYDCGPLLATMLTNRGVVDADGDGVWTKEDCDQLGKQWEKEYDKDASLFQVLEHYLDLAYSGGLMAQEGLSHSQSLQMTKNFTQLPVAWVDKETERIELCIGADPNLCGNFEERGILPRLFPNPRWTKNKRIQTCKNDLNHYCSDILGQFYEMYNDWSAQLCGEATSLWVKKERIIATSYAKANKYAVGYASITSPVYAAFLMIMLGIWWMSIFVEIRLVIKWWVVLCWYPDAPKQDDELLAMYDGGLRVKFLPRPYKIMTLILNLLPRTVLALWLAVVGSNFLITADDYSDLILNGVALAFLIEVDNVLFSAVASDYIQNIMGEAEPLKVQVRVPWLWVRFARTVTRTTIYTVFLVCVIFSFIYHAYIGEGGKLQVGEALRCLCHAAGTDCVTAQVLGGAPLLRMNM
eukprot:TRINITY_DN62171_c0_g1_i1.p1 TRINITY_DN62171_c0_g1~~TRINITY_DN62171_c0_g1_i1.p1  ORF type:complete len:548 (-),score=55.72 TRINITY_DN62171_c0_g1_i1:109-1752(-)